MNTNGALISVDDHVQISEDDVRKRLSPDDQEAFNEGMARYNAHVLNDLMGGIPWSNVKGRTRPDGWTDPTARLADLDLDGVQAQILYCEFSSFRLLPYMGSSWKAVARAVNDALSEFASHDPKRLLISYQIPLIDIDHAVEEVHRLAAEGARSVHLPSLPHECNAAQYYDPAYAPLWDALCEHEIPVSIHLGTPEMLYEVYRRDPSPGKGIFASLPPMMLAEPLAMFLQTGILERHPDLKVVMVEPGLGWVPWYLDQLDFAITAPEFAFEPLEFKPSETFRRQMYLTFINDPRGLEMRHEIGVENIMWSSDYPHVQTSWPNSREVIETQFAGIPVHEKELIIRTNATRLYGL